jgi:hypothetical protein
MFSLNQTSSNEQQPYERQLPMINNVKKWVPLGVEVERWLCNPRVSGSNHGAGNLEKVVYLDENSWTHTKS